MGPALLNNIARLSRYRLSWPRHGHESVRWGLFLDNGVCVADASYRAAAYAARRHNQVLRPVGGSVQFVHDASILGWLFEPFFNESEIKLLRRPVIDPHLPCGEASHLPDVEIGLLNIRVACLNASCEENGVALACNRSNGEPCLAVHLDRAHKLNARILKCLWLSDQSLNTLFDRDVVSTVDRQDYGLSCVLDVWEVLAVQHNTSAQVQNDAQALMLPEVVVPVSLIEPANP